MFVEFFFNFMVLKNKNFKRWDMYQGKRNPLRAEA